MIDLRIGDVRQQLREMEAGSVHVNVSSPPYWALRSYLPADHPNKSLELGSEPTIELFVENMCSVYDEVWRVLRDDGLCFVNLGDSYAGGGGYCPTAPSAAHSKSGKYGATVALVKGGARPLGLSAGNQCLVPYKFAIAMQERGWVLRSTIIWAKAISVDAKMGSVMPESLNGTRWERCRVKVGRSESTTDGGVPSGWRSTQNPDKKGRGHNSEGSDHRMLAEWTECPGCSKCSANDGYVLRRGSWRPTNASEVIYMFSKGMGYYADIEAVKESVGIPTRRANGFRGCESGAYVGGKSHDNSGEYINTAGDSKPSLSGSNIRSVWHIAEEYSIDDLFAQFLESLRPDNMVDVAHIKTQAFPGSHFATFPEAIPSLAIRVGTSEKGVCPSCKAPWARVVESTQLKRERPNDYTKRTGEDGTGNSCGNTVAGVESKTIGWRPTCDCNAGEPVPATVLDHFAGSGTSLVVAEALGRDSVGIDVDEAARTHLAKRQAAIRKRDADRFGIKRQTESLEGQRSLF